MAASTKLEIWQKDLIDMSRMNTLLHFRSSGRGAGIQFQIPDVNQWFMEFLSNHRSHALKHIPSNLPPDELERALVRLRARARDDLNDRGIHTLYLAFGLLSWREAEHSEEVIRSPLLLVPVTLWRDGVMGDFSLQRFGEEDVEINPTLREKLNHDFRIQLPTYAELEEAFEHHPGPASGHSSPADHPSLQWIIEQLRELWPAHFQWDIEPSVHLGRFSFQKLVMYQDLIHHRDEILAHPLLQALGGNKASVPGTTSIQPHQLDQVIHPRDSLEILDADSSQQEAILAAKRGDSFVLQGPPGTGKSQTIANIIAESLGIGRKVLFVSEKMAALEVVQQRLHAARLGEFCLDLHNPRADKKLFIQEVQGALSERVRQPNLSGQADWNRESDGLFQTREELNRSIRELHLPRFALEQSAFTITGKLAQLEDTPDCDFHIPQVQTIDQGRLNALVQSLEELDESRDVLDQHETHPWRDTLVQNTNFAFEASIRDHFGRFSRELAELQTSLSRIRDGLGEEQALCTFDWTRYAMECAQRILQSPRPPRHWLHFDTLQNIRRLAQDAAEQSTSYHAHCAALSSRYHRSLLQLDHGALHRALTEEAVPIARGLQPQGQTPQDSSITLREALDQHLGAAISLLPRLTQAASAISEASYQQPPMTLEQTTTLKQLVLLLLSTPNPPEPWLRAEQFSSLRSVALDASERYNACARLRSSLEPLYESAYFELDLHALAERFKEKYQSAFRWLRPRYHQDIKRLKSHLRPGTLRTNAQLVADLSQAVKVFDEETRLREQRLEHSRVLGHYFNGAHTDWHQVSAALTWTADFHAAFGGVLSPETLRIVTGPLQTRTVLHSRYQHFVELWEQWENEAASLSRMLTWGGILGHPTPLERVEMRDLEAALKQFHATLHAFWQAMDTIVAHRLTSRASGEASPASFSWAEIVQNLQRAAWIVRFETWLREHYQQLMANLGPVFTGADTDWTSLFSMLDWTEDFLRFSPHQQLPEKMAELISPEGEESTRTSLSDVFNATRACLERIRIELAYAEEQVLPRHALLPAGKTLEMVTPGTVQERVDFFLEQLPQLEHWLTCQQRIKQCHTQGLGGFITSMQRQRPFPHNIAQIFERRFYVLWLDEVRRQSPTLSQFQGELHQKRINHFRQLDERHQQLAQQRLRSQLLQRRSALLAEMGTWRNTIISDALTDLVKEAQKKRHRPIRQIVRRVAPALLEIKPCWMMSPLSVSQFLESGNRLFDVVIFDEASQVCPEDAISAILRGKQLIVVGDSRQLPPTRFFSKTLADEEEEELPGGEELLENERMESILDECVGAGYSQRSLLWHYRSRHESLIAFSNHHFYQNHLVTFPSSAAEHQAGVRFISVAGAVYDRGSTRTNRREAERVAQLVFEHLRQKPNHSLGVVALSEAQQTAIRDAIEGGVRRRPELRAWEKELSEENPAGFFVKNLESVQGDERDVIILSIGYGPDASGRIHQNFGPVNKAGGERRLNVAVTRARHQIIVVASMRASDLSGDLRSPGARTLRSYLAYAEHGPAALSDAALAIDTGVTSQEEHFDSPFEEAVYRALTAKGLQLDTQVGCSEYRIDLAVRHPQHPRTYLMGIECDGRTYHSSATARDRDRLRQRHLEQMGWTIHRIWSTDWLRNPAREMTKVLEQYHHLLQTTPLAPHEEKPKQEPLATDGIRHPTHEPEPVGRGTLAFQSNTVEVANDNPVGKKRIELRETTIENPKPGLQPPQTLTGSIQVPGRVSHFSQTNPSNTRESNPSSTPVHMPEHTFLAGEYVKHPIYGIGTVVSDGNTVIEVDFGGQAGKRTIFPERIHLEKVPRTPPSSTTALHQDTPTRGAFNLSAFLREKGLTSIDNRPTSGALWVVGGSELTPLMQDLAKKGFMFTFKPDGSKATGGKPGWWYN